MLSYELQTLHIFTVRKKDHNKIFYYSYYNQLVSNPLLHMPPPNTSALKKASRLQAIQNLVPSVVWRRQCDIQIAWLAVESEVKLH